jgi:diguanylate cyclase (GGDEF)-like protein
MMLQKLFQTLLQIMSERRNKNTFAKYLIALGILGLAIIIRLTVPPLSTSGIYLTFHFPIILIALILGAGPAFVSLFFSVLAIIFIFWPPFFSLAPDFNEGAFKLLCIFLVESFLLISIIGLIRNELVRREKRLEELAFYDPLTQVLNRRLFEDRLDQTLKNAERHQQYGALLIIDLDKLKELNDAHGHQLGDVILVEAAKRMKGTVREIDTVARIGGDEFAIILSELNGDYLAACSEAKKISEKLCQTLSIPLLDASHEKLSKSNNSKVYSFSASIGITVFMGGQITQEELLSQADIAMYEAKKAGGNQAQIYKIPDDKCIAALGRQVTVSGD